MKRNAIAIVAFVVGLGCGVAVAAPLTIVTHDPTLAGNGTAASPLRVVSPYTGVTHDGTLAGNGTPASPLSVVSPYTGVTHDGSLTVFDANGALVGKVDSTGIWVVRKIVDTWVKIQYGPSTSADPVPALIASMTGQIVFLYATTDCTGTAYMHAEGLVTNTYSLGLTARCRPRQRSYNSAPPCTRLRPFRVFGA